MLIFRIPYLCIPTSVLQGTVCVSLVLHAVPDIKVQPCSTILDVLYTSISCIYSLKMTP